MKSLPLSRNRIASVSTQTDLSELRRAAERYQRGGPVKRVLSIVIGLAFGLALLEGMVRFGLGSSPATMRAEMTELVGTIRAPSAKQLVAEGLPRPTDATVENLVPHPFTGWEDEHSLARIDRDLLRERELRANPVQARRTLRVLVTGGSVAHIFRRRGAAVLQEKLLSSAALSGRKIEFLHYARSAYKQPQQVNQLAYLLALGLEPDVVLNIDGYNEVAIGYENQVCSTHPVYPSLSHWSTVSGGFTSAEAGLDHLTALWTLRRESERILEQYTSTHEAESALLGELRLRQLRALHDDWNAAQASYKSFLAESGGVQAMRGPAFDGDLSVTLNTVREMWVESSRSMHALCRERDIVYLHVLQPTMLDRKAGKPLSLYEEELLAAARLGAAPEFFEVVRKGYDALRDGGRELGLAGVAFLDASECFAEVEETLYADSVHFNRAGNERLGKRVAARLLTLLR